MEGQTTRAALAVPLAQHQQQEASEAAADPGSDGDPEEHLQLLGTADLDSDEDPDEYLELHRTIFALQRELAMARSQEEKNEVNRGPAAFSPDDKNNHTMVTTS